MKIKERKGRSDMASGVADVRVREVVRGMTMTVNVHGLRVQGMRFAIAKPLFRLAVWVAGLGGCEFET